jgi:nitrile hydratase alpha subunit
MDQAEQAKKMRQLIAKCWADEGFKQKVLADPAATLTSEGVELPAGLSIKAVENTDKVFHLVIPARPTDLSDEDLDMVVGGSPGAGRDAITATMPGRMCDRLSLAPGQLSSAATF